MSVFLLSLFFFFIMIFIYFVFLFFVFPSLTCTDEKIFSKCFCLSFFKYFLPLTFFSFFFVHVFIVQRSCIFFVYKKLCNTCGIKWKKKCYRKSKFLIFKRSVIVPTTAIMFSLISDFFFSFRFLECIPFLHCDN